MSQPPGFEAVLTILTRPDDEPGRDAATWQPDDAELEANR